MCYYELLSARLFTKEVFELLVARLFFDEIIEPPPVDDAIFKF
jgi:hypothetical protein